MPAEEIIIADSSPLIGLARIGKLQLLLLIDDLRARKLAQRLGLRRIGTIGLLGLAKREGLIPKLKPCLDALIANQIFIGQDLMDAALRDAGE